MSQEGFRQRGREKGIFLYPHHVLSVLCLVFSVISHIAFGRVLVYVSVTVGISFVWRHACIGVEHNMHSDLVQDVLGGN